MDIVTDLTSQCVSFITVMQEVYKQQLPSGPDDTVQFGTLIEEISDENFKPDPELCDESFNTRVRELIWASEGRVVNADIIACFFEAGKALFLWVAANSENQSELPNLYSSSYQWRACVRKILYDHYDQRITLAGILEYMPIQIVFCLGGGDYSAAEQRKLQIWEPSCNLNPLTGGDKKEINDWWAKKFPEKKFGKHENNEEKKTRSAFAKDLLEDDQRLLYWLLKENNPVPFENVFIDELNEIEKSRVKRKHIAGTDTHWADSSTWKANADPYERADKMKLYGLAFSGGGIRSATFNLGILQRLSEIGMLSRFDYLSTVSGGGYIGSWWVSWIKRSGSMSKVSDRLNPRKSSDPLADEVRPIRWLRMFSNYLTPNASIMSTDSWTMGVTWFRNTTINQVLLLMLLCSVLALIKFTYKLWFALVGALPDIKNTNLFADSGIILVTGAVFAGWGMHAFGPEHPPKGPKLEKGDKLYYLLMVWGIVSTFLVGAWLYHMSDTGINFTAKFDDMKYTVVAGMVAFILVAFLGRYDKCAPDRHPGEVIGFIIFSSIVAAFAGTLFLCISWEVFEQIFCASYAAIKSFNHKLAFIFGVPMILESISITVVVRMSIMGSLFPDLRREWWGRMGALVHRFIFIWLLVATGALLLPEYLHSIQNKILSFPAIFGGWSAIIGYAVKLAYGSKSPDQQANKGSLSPSELFIRFAPYLFAVGFLVLGSFVLRYIELLMESWLGVGSGKNAHDIWVYLAVGLGLGVITLGLSQRVGVNEFSLHYFYRNRLTRAYLGATRRREARDKTVNNFTNFDDKDDIPLTDFCTAKSYYGPYPLINTTLNSTVVTDLDRQDRMGESFVFTSKFCGFDVCRTRPSSNTKQNLYEYAYRPTRDFAYPGGPHLGTAMTISGAAVSPNMGYHSSPATAFLLTIFNVRLGWWIGNPRTKKFWRRANPLFGIAYLVYDLVGKSNITDNFVSLSDGGHFDNMGLYELVRRKCRYVLLCDAEEDEQTMCEGLANAIRRCRIDYGVEIAITLDPITKKDPKTGYCKSHIARGTIWYPGDDKPSGVLVYVKTSLTGKESVDIREYFMANPAFPQQSTADQFFDESQFESYRKLGFQSI